ncbi:RRP12-like protein isoform X3 [Alosa sapidissima]|uniref:RRP12-like protein isoform X3 n=1 Tax=Alosa sapidissima TaxID=34773 RepID=UPI001C09E60E|nr:RRP12-like protein isoform X3 [Alosa sapidissima]
MVKSGKLRSGTAQKLKRWKKGHSSDSNPETSRYRQAARSRFFSRPSEKSGLTVDALKLHDDLQGGAVELGEGGEDMDEAEQALSQRSGATFLSGVSDCSNLSFRKVQRYWESNSAAHKEICAVLAAVTDVIRTQGGKETETEYFAALMTTLEAVDSSESLAAVAYLLNLVLKRVPVPVLKNRFSDTTKAFMDVMSSQANSDSSSALRWILSCLALMLKKQDVSVWSYPSTLQAYHGLLSFTVHSKPKVRKAAQQGVCSILRGSDFLFSDSRPAHHPAAVTTAKFCCKEIEQAGGSKEDTTTLHVLGLLKELLPCFPIGSTKSCCETLLRVMTLSHALVTAGAMQAFHKLLSSQPSSSPLSAELNAQIINALYDYLPSENDLQPLLAWLAVMEKAHTHLASLQSSLCLAHLPRFFSIAMSCLLSPHTKVVSTATQAMKTLLEECVSPHMSEVGPVLPGAASGNPSHIVKMFRCVEEGLSYRFHASWPFVLQVLGCFYRGAGKQAHAIMAKSLQSLCDLRSTPRFPFGGELDLAVGGAVESMGPELLLKAIPLLITGHQDDLEFPRSWLVPVIRDHLKNTQLAFFSSYFLPLANTLKRKAEELDQAGQKLESKVYQTLEQQIWTMLPGFCQRPTDVVGGFAGLARTLGSALNERPDLRLPICQALRTLIRSAETAEEKAELGRFSKNFLPILFNVFTQKPPESDSAPYRPAVLDTIRVYLTVTEPELVCSFLQKATEKLSGADSSEFTRLAVMDLVVAMAPCVDEATMTQTYELIKPYLESKEAGVQKKAYRVLEEMCGGEGEASRSFVINNLQQLQGALLSSLKTAASPAKRPRLKCLIHIMKQLKEEHKDFIITLLPEVIICTKEVSLGARKNAFSLLVEMGNAFTRFCGNQKDALEEFLSVVYVGLTGTVTMMTCTVLALSRLVFHYRDSIESSTLEQLLHNVCLLLTCRTRQILKVALGFLKVILYVLDVKTLAGHLTVMMEAIGNIKDDMRRHFRASLKSIFTKLIRKFGFELVKDMLPAEHHKVLANIRKVEARSKRKREALKAEEEGSDSEADAPKARGDSIEDILADSDSDMSEEEGPKKKAVKKTVKKKGGAWLKEGLSDEPLNFLDPGASQRVLATNPEVKTRKAQHGFKVTSDGRLLIEDEEDKQKKSKAAEAGDLEDILEEAGIKSKSQKRKANDDLDDDDMEVESQSRYKAGGVGIHRPLGGRQESGADYRAKKGKGDVKKKGKVDPYAYIPLKKAQLNRRKKAKLQGQFKGMVRGAHKGALAAKRMKKNQKRA